jgi:hypothetical protein
MKNKDQIILESLYEKVLLETRNSAFLRELDPLFDKWEKIQSNIKGTIPTYAYNSDGDPYDKPDAGQKLDKKDLPVYYQNQKKSVLSNTEHHRDRRVHFKQTDAEVELDKELLRIFQKYADQNYFRNDVLFNHDFAYPAAYSWGSDDGPSSKEVEEYYLKNENKTYKDVLSCHGRDISRSGLMNIGNYGIIVKGHVVFASRGDLASQTTRVAPKFVRDFFKNSGIPKRTSIERIHSKAEGNTSLELRQRFNQRLSKPPMTQDEINDFLNNVVLDKNDSPSIEEALLANWKIESWFFSRLVNENGSNYPYPYNFWKKAYENNIQKPIYYFELNSDKPPVKVDLSEYFK